MSKIMLNELSAEERNRAWVNFIDSPEVKKTLCDWFFDGVTVLEVGMNLDDLRSKMVMNTIRASYTKFQDGGA